MTSGTTKRAAPDGGDQCIEIGIVTQSRIDTKMIDRIVSVCRRAEDWSKCDARCSKLDGIVQPTRQVIKAMSDRGVPSCLRLGSSEAERIYLPPYSVFDPTALVEAMLEGNPG